MLIIQSIFYQITIPDNEPYAIYTDDYFLDKDGNRTTDLDKAYEYGDIIFQTSSAKYIFKKVYCAYEFTTMIMDYIKERCNDKVILIDMYDLSDKWEYSCGTFEIETLS